MPEPMEEDLAPEEELLDLTEIFETNESTGQLEFEDVRLEEEQEETIDEAFPEFPDVIETPAPKKSADEDDDDDDGWVSSLLEGKGD